MIKFFICLLLSVNCYAETIYVYGNKEKPPKYWNDENGVPKGILVDMMKIISEDTGIQFNIQLYKWKKAYSMSEKGKGIIIGLSMNNERKKIFDYSSVMFYDDIMIAVLKGNEFDYNTINDFRGRIVSVFSKVSYGNDYEQAIKSGSLNILTTSSSEQRFWALFYGQADATLIGPGRAGFNGVFAKSKDLMAKKNRFTLLEKPFKSDPNYIGVPKIMDKSHILDSINQSIAKNWSNGVFEIIVNKHSG